MKTQNWLLKQSSTQPDKVAITDGQKQLTFSQLRDVVAANTGRLNQLKPGKFVGVLTDNTLVGYEIAMTVLASGRTIVWLNWRLAKDELDRQMADSQLACCLVADSLVRPTMDKRFISFEHFLKIPAQDGQLTSIKLPALCIHPERPGILKEFCKHLATTFTQRFRPHLIWV